AGEKWVAGGRHRAEHVEMVVLEREIEPHELHPETVPVLRDRDVAVARVVVDAYVVIERMARLSIRAAERRIPGLRLPLLGLLPRLALFEPLAPVDRWKAEQPVIHQIGNEVP